MCIRDSNNTDITDNKYLEKKFVGGSNKYKVTSIIPAIMIIFITVPIPGFCFRKIHKNKTLTLTKKVAVPIDISIFFEIPSANTDHGELPVVDKTKRPSPRPNSTNPKQRKKNVENLGLKFKGFSELQVFDGIFLIVKNIL